MCRGVRGRGLHRPWSLQGRRRERIRGVSGWAAFALEPAYSTTTKTFDEVHRWEIFGRGPPFPGTASARRRGTATPRSASAITSPFRILAGPTRTPGGTSRRPQFRSVRHWEDPFVEGLRSFQDRCADMVRVRPHNYPGRPSFPSLRGLRRSSSSLAVCRGRRSPRRYPPSRHRLDSFSMYRPVPVSYEDLRGSYSAPGGRLPGRGSRSTGVCLEVDLPRGLRIHAS